MKKNIRISLALAITAMVAATASSCVPMGYETIAEKGETLYRVVRSDETDVGGEGAAIIKKSLERVTDGKVEIMADFEHEKLGTMRIDTEILVGPTNRDESSAHEREFTYLDYAIDFDTTRISITGGSSAALVNAANYFGEKFVFEGSGKVALPKGQVVEYYHDYPVDSVTINGTPIEEFVIVADSSDGRAGNFARAFYPIYGKAPKVVAPNYKDKVDYEIVLSSAKDPRYTEHFETLGDFESNYTVEGSKIFVGTSGMLSDENAWEMFVSDLFGSDFALLAGDIAIADCTRSESIPTAFSAEADEALFAEVDAKAGALKDKIMTSENLEIPENAVVYYVSPNGDDSADGTSPETAWKTLSKVNSLDYPGKAYVLFERGGIWRGQISAKGKKVYSAYGEGPKPALYGGHEDGAKPEKWSLMEGTDNIWIYKDNMIDSGTLVFNGGEQIAYKEIPSYRDGKFVTRADNTIEFDIIKALDVDLDFFHKADSVLTNNAYPTSGTATGEIYLRCDAGNPGEIFDSIEFVPRRNGFAIAGDDVTIDNFTIKYIGAHGIGSGTRKNLIVTNCEIGWIGGGIQSYAANGDTNQRATRFGNGVEIYGGCDNFIVDNCYVYQCYDAGLTHQYKSEKAVKQENVTYSNNLIENCVYSIEYFLNEFEDPAQSMYNIKMYDNILRYAGFGWGNQRPDKGSQAHIKGWDHDNPAKGFDIYNNIFDRSSNWILHLGYKYIESEPRVYDNIFIQYKDGLLGRYGLIPTKVLPYDIAMLADERLLENKFYFIDENCPRYAGDRGELAVMYNGMRIYEPGETVELHGNTVTDAAEIAKISEAFKKAVETSALVGGFAGEPGEGSIKIGEVQYDAFASCETMADLENLLLASFDSELVEAFKVRNAESEVPVFVESEGVLYRLGGYASQYGIDGASCKLGEMTLADNGIVTISAHVTFGDAEGVEFDTVYMCTKGEDGVYRFVSAFEAPIALALKAMAG